MSDYPLTNLTQWLARAGVNLEKLEKIFFALFLLSIPLQTRLTLTNPQTFLNNSFNEYVTFFVYLSDIFIITTLILFFVNILTKNNNFSISIKNLSTYPRLIPTILCLLITWSLATTLWTTYPETTLYQTLKLLELSLIAFYISSRLYWFGKSRAFFLIFTSGTLQAIIGITQYLNQKSLGLKLLGESNISPTIDNVAKIVVDGEKIIRAYGTFPHPNIFGAFLVLSTILSFWLVFSLNPKKQTVSRLPSEASTGKNMPYLKQNTNEIVWLLILTSGTILQLIALILTFSRLAWIGESIAFTILLFYIYKLFHARPPKLTHIPEKASSLKQNSSIVSRETILPWRSWVRQFRDTPFNIHKVISAFIIVIAILTSIGLLKNQILARTADTFGKQQQSINYRILYNDIALRIIKQYPLTGIGTGNFTLRMKDYSSVPLEWWQYQPSHNIYLLIASELGITGLIIFIFFVFRILNAAYLKQKDNYEFYPPTFIYKLFHVKQLTNYPSNKPKNLRDEEISAGKRGTILVKSLILSIFVGFLFMGLFDHYFWTLQQGQLIFWFTIGSIMAISNRNI